MPGELSRRQTIERMLRVNHAGEYGAVRIYEGQLAVLGDSDKAPIIEHMIEQEREHLSAFDELVVENRVRPTAMLPFWHVAGFMLGAGTALMGARSAMACTVAIEEVIDSHYKSQIKNLGEEDVGLRNTFEKFRQEEAEHRDTGIQQEAEKAPGYSVLTGLIKSGSRFAIWLSERV